MNCMQRYCFALDLKDNDDLIKQYEEHHRNVPDEIIRSITSAGITSMDIYRTGNRLFMVMETDDSFSFDRKKQADESNEEVQKWEALMWQFQQALPWSKETEKWLLLSHIFHLKQ